MESLHTSYDNKNKKEDLKIKFEKFPGDVKKEKIKKRKKIISYIITILILIILFVGSSVLNSYILYGNDTNDYKIVNEFSDNYAIIKSDQRPGLFEKIGFDFSVQVPRYINSKSYIATSASRSSTDGLSDSIEVYYDKNDCVVYIVMNLVYNREGFSISKATNDCNSILKNFVKLNTSKNAISETISNGFYYIMDSESGIEATYELFDDEESYNIMVIVEK